MLKLKQVAKSNLARVPLLHHLFWRGKMVLSSGSNRVKVVTFHDAVSAVERWLRLLPCDFDCVIGIPRSGLMVASLVALKTGKPLSTPSAFLRGEVWQSLHVERQPIRKVLIVEDDIIYGKQISRAYRELKRAFPDVEFKTASLFVTSQSKGIVDYFYRVKNPPLLYEWTLLSNMAGMGKLAVDMDGVLCDEQGVKPYMIPQFPVEAVITSRLECQRAETEAWLKQHNVRYGKLLMLTLPSGTKKTLDAITTFKADAIRQVQPFWYWESNAVEAEAIRSKTGVPVLCTATLELLV